MPDETPNLITEDEFNAQVLSWALAVRDKSRANLNSTHGSGALESSDSASVRKSYNVAESIAFKFNRYGVFVHYGVGRGYIRSGGTVIRGSKTPLKGNAHHAPASGAVERTPIDWLNKEINNNLESLGDTAMEFYGDSAMQKILSQIDKAKIH